MALANAHAGTALLLRGPVLVRAAFWATPSALSALVLSLVSSHTAGNSFALPALWIVFSLFLGLLIVVRTQQAHRRYLERASLLKCLRGQWLHAASSLVSYCDRTEERRGDVEAFQHLLVRLMSMLHGAVLQDAVAPKVEPLDVLSYDGLDPESIQFLDDNGDQRSLVILQWIQRLVVDSIDSGILLLPAPLVSRIFQDLSGGVASAGGAERAAGFRPPPPPAQLASHALLAMAAASPLLAGALTGSMLWAALLTLISALAFWGTSYLAEKIECSWGDDVGGLLVERAQAEMNRQLCILLHPRAQRQPGFELRDRDRQLPKMKLSGNLSNLHGAREVTCDVLPEAQSGGQGYRLGDAVVLDTKWARPLPQEQTKATCNVIPAVMMAGKGDVSPLAMGTAGLKLLQPAEPVVEQKLQASQGALLEASALEAEVSARGRSCTRADKIESLLLLQELRNRRQHRESAQARAVSRSSTGSFHRSRARSDDSSIIARSTASAKPSATTRREQAPHGAAPGPERGPAVPRAKEVPSDAPELETERQTKIVL